MIHLDTARVDAVKRSLSDTLPQHVELEDGTKVSLYALKHAMKVEHIAELLIDWLNGYSGSTNAIKLAAYICQAHRTLQQEFIRFFFQVLISIPAFTWGTDPRNEAGIQLCKVLQAEHEHDHLPLI